MRAHTQMYANVGLAVTSGRIARMQQGKDDTLYKVEMYYDSQQGGVLAGKQNWWYVGGRVSSTCAGCRRARATPMPTRFAGTHQDSTDRVHLVQLVLEGLHRGQLLPWAERAARGDGAPRCARPHQRRAQIRRLMRCITAYARAAMPLRRRGASRAQHEAVRGFRRHSHMFSAPRSPLGDEGPLGFDSSQVTGWWNAASGGWVSTMMRAAQAWWSLGDLTDPYGPFGPLGERGPLTQEQVYGSMYLLLSVPWTASAFAHNLDITGVWGALGEPRLRAVPATSATDTRSR